MRRVYRHYTDMEEYRPNGMWRNVAGQEQRQAYIDAASALMADPARFKDAMLRAIEEWPNSCEVAMTTPSLNHLAWFGHAGCCIATGSPEDCTHAWRGTPSTNMSRPQRTMPPRRSSPNGGVG